MVTLGIIIVSTNDGHWLKSCLSTLSNSSYTDYLVVVIDNMSNDATLEICREAKLPLKILQSTELLGFAAANNLGLKELTAQGCCFAFLLNPDTKVDTKTLEVLVQALQSNGDYAVLGCMQYKYDSWEQLNAWTSETLQEAKILGSVAHKENNWTLIDHYYVQGAALCFPLSLLREIGPLEPVFGTFYEETEFCRRCLYSGKKVALLEEAKIQHAEGGYWKRSRRARWWRDILFLRNQFIFFLSSPDLQGAMLRNALELIFQQVKILYKKEKGVILPLFLYPIVLYGAFRRVFDIFRLRAQNLQIIAKRSQ